MAQSVDHDTLIERLAVLERQVRRMRTLGALAVVAVVAALTVGATYPPSIVKARMFLVVDDRGKERAQLGLSTDGEALLSLLDARETHRASFGLYDGGEPYLKLAEKRGRTRVWLQAMDDARDGRNTGLYVADDHANPRATLTVDGRGAPTMSFLDDDERNRIWLGSTANGASFVVLGDERARPRLSLRTDDDGRPALQLFDGGANSRVMLAMGSSDAAYLTLTDRSGHALFSAPQASARIASAASPFPR
jgi:hypothetical protein